MPRKRAAVHRRRIEVDARRRRRIWAVYGVIAVIVALAFASGIASVRGEMIDAANESRAAQIAELNAARASAEEQKQADDANEAQAQAQAQTASAEVDPASLAWRDADFAVDANRTEWNFEPVDRKVVYLTIDDGPSENTQAVLDILDRYGCKATFFVVGHNEDYFPMIAEAYRRGHTIGLHSMTHDYGQVYSSVEAYFEDLDEIGEVVEGQIGYKPCFIRFPGGSSNMISADYTEGIMTVLAERVQDMGYQYYDWNLSTGDGADHTAEELVGYACEPIEAENIVLLCHDSATKQTTVEALPAIIEHFQSLGYSFEALNRDSCVCHHEVGN